MFAMLHKNKANLHRTTSVFNFSDLEIPNPQYTLDTNYRIAYQRPQYHPDMPDDIKHTRTAYTPYETSAIGIRKLYMDQYLCRHLSYTESTGFRNDNIIL